MDGARAIALLEAIRDVPPELDARALYCAAVAYQTGEPLAMFRLTIERAVAVGAPMLPSDRHAVH